MKGVILLLIALFVVNSFAINYYVDPVNGDDTNDGKSTSTAWKTMSANYHVHGMLPGDIMYLRGGEYISDLVNAAPFSPVTPQWDVPLTIAAYPGETPILTGPASSSYFYLFDSAWVLDGLTFASPDMSNFWIFLTNAHNSTVRNCHFGVNYGISTTVIKSNFVTFENNTYTLSGLFDQEGADHITIQGSNHTLIQNNYFGTARHYGVDTLAFDGSNPTYTVVRNNVFENKWGGGVGPIMKTSWTLVEDNVFRYMGSDIDYPKAAVSVNSDYAIIRRNVMEKTGWANATDTDTADVCLAIYSFYFGGVHQSCQHNRVYNNLMYKCGSAAVGITTKDSSISYDNIIVNNIIYGAAWAGDKFQYLPNGNYSFLFNSYWADANYRWPEQEFARGRANITNNLILNLDLNGNPQPNNPSAVSWVQTDTFTWSIEQVEDQFPDVFSHNVNFEPGLVDPESENYDLRSDSKSIDAGAHLTYAIGSGDNTNVIVVYDSLYFFDGWDMGWKGVDADLLQIGSNSPVRIVSIDYDTHTITLESNISYQDGDPVSLPYYGSKPDLGVKEYVPAPVAPINSPSVINTPVTTPGKPIASFANVVLPGLFVLFCLGVALLVM